MCLPAFSLAFSVIFDLTSAIKGCSAVLVLLRCCKWLPSDELSAFLDITLLDVVERTVMALFFGGEASYRSSIFIISPSCASFLSLLLCILVFHEVFFTSFSRKTL